LTLVDTNVLLDIVTADPSWLSWSRSRLAMAALAGPLVINDVIYAEVSVRFESIDALETALSGLGVRLDRFPRAALFLAAKAFRRYRGQGGVRTGVLADFFIGAHAAVQDCDLLTRDAGRYRSYFPSVRLILPD
jgi:predicted nucleic acid-binding protein